MSHCFRIAICIALIFPSMTLVTSQTKTVSKKVTSEIFQQLIKDCRAAAPNPASWDETPIDKPASEYIEVRTVPLSPGKTNYLITGKEVPFYGAHAEMYWIYEKTASGYRQVDELGANYSVRVLQTSHNGYRDLTTTYVAGAGTVLDSCKLKFNGHKYVSAGCTSKRL